MRERKAALEKFLNDTWRLGLFALQFVILAIFVVVGIRVVQMLPPVTVHNPGEIMVHSDDANR